MKIIGHERPPMYDAIAERFPDADVAHAIFSWGDRIYNLSGAPLTPALLAHEMVHCARQTRPSPADAPGAPAWTPELWWQMYLASDTFRFEEELLAHAAEFRVMVMGKNRHYRRAALITLARRLSGPLYGRVVSTGHAKRWIMEAAK